MGKDIDTNKISAEKLNEIEEIKKYSTKYQKINEEIKQVKKTYKDWTLEHDLAKNNDQVYLKQIQELEK